MSRIAIALACCLLLAGCTAPTAPSQTQTQASSPTTPDSVADSPDESATDPGSESRNESATTRAALEDIPVSGGSLSVEHERVFARTTGLLGVNVSPPTVVVVKPAAEIRGGTGESESDDEEPSSRSFAGVMGIYDDGRSEDGENDGGNGEEGDESDEDQSGVAVAAYAPSAHSVIVNERMTASGRESSLERTMAHEFVHTVQYRQQAFDRTRRALGVDGSVTRDTYLTYVSVVEGAAAFVGEAYDRRYLAGDWATITERERYRSSPARVKYKIARYYFGERYLRHRFSSPANVSAVYDDPPQTTEQLLHNDTDASEKPKALDLSVDPGANRMRGQTDTYGELFARIALGTELTESRAADAAAGWGADRLVPVVGPDGTHNYVWATRWDSPAEADEFGAAMADYLSSRANQSAEDGTWRDSSDRGSDEELTFRTVRTSEETVVLLAGDESFVGAASVSGTNASVSVVAGDDRR
ncbi:hypothetical protein [Halorussus ruber]|uniref:hypothetical protein n=1 Tax=Halorussus ruber TaxID=1126238 RepID=UPI001092E200|nr:hypothetical protein [Halorussus ruber]